MKGKELIKLLSEYEDEEICILADDCYYAVDWVKKDEEDGVLIVAKYE